MLGALDQLPRWRNSRNCELWLHSLTSLREEQHRWTFWTPGEAVEAERRVGLQFSIADIMKQ